MFVAFTKSSWLDRNPEGQNLLVLAFLSALIDLGWHLADLVVDEPFRSLHGPWLTAHPWGIQQDAVEYSGWMRDQFM